MMGENVEGELLPPQQPVVLTPSCHTCIDFLDLLRRIPHLTGYASMGAITGEAGLGKSVAVTHYLAMQTPRAHTGVPGVMLYTLKPRSTPRALAEGLIETLHDRPKGRTVYKFEAEAALAIQRNDIDLLIIDEADRLNEESFELLRHLFDTTNCPVVLVGLPNLLRIIHLHAKFLSRMGPHFRFLPLTEAQVIEMVLPQLRLPFWQFDPTNPDDRALGHLLWQQVRPSFRRLRVVLQYAAGIAEANPHPQITIEEITLALQLAHLPYPDAPPPPRAE